MVILAITLGILRALIMCGAGAALGHGAVYLGLIVAGATLVWGVKSHIVTSEQFASLARGLIAAGGGWAIHTGVATQSDVELTLGIFSTLAPIAWTAISHYRSGANVPSEPWNKQAN